MTISHDSQATRSRTKTSFTPLPNNPQSQLILQKKIKLLQTACGYFFTISKDCKKNMPSPIFEASLCWNIYNIGRKDDFVTSECTS